MNSLLLGEQEKTLTRDLLYVLSGVNGSLISIYSIPGSNRIGFTVDDRIDGSLKEQALEIATAASHYRIIQKYIENASSFELGKVNHALAAQMKKMLKQYFILLGQLETMYSKGELNLQSLWFHIHESIGQLSIISSIASTIEEKNCRGGMVLSILQEKSIVIVGDDVGKGICLALAEAACEPYFRMLENWIYKGIIKDPFNEFFISQGIIEESNLYAYTGDYWENCYKCNIDACPGFLKKVALEILKAGKYLNVIRQCGKDVTLFKGSRISYSLHEHAYIEFVKDAYNMASKTLLDLLLKDYDLMKRIVSVKHYLLIDQGDFIVQFLDLSENELAKGVDDLNETRLTSLLELALRTCSCSSDPYKDNVKVELFPNGIRDMLLNMITIGSPLENETFQNPGIIQIPGVEAFSLKVEGKWPVSLVLNDWATFHYQLIFRHLFFSKHVERRLCQAWIQGKSAKSVDLKKNVEIAAGFALRQKMLNFVQNLLYYMAFEVIEPAWHIFVTTMGKVRNIDEVIDAHTLLLSSIVHDCMLTSSEPMDKISGILSYCLQFAESFTKSKSSVFSESFNDNEKPASQKSVIELDQGFSDLLVDFLRDVSAFATIQNPNQSSKVMNILHRLNYNGYYNGSLNVEVV